MATEKKGSKGERDGEVSEDKTWFIALEASRSRYLDRTLPRVVIVVVVVVIVIVAVVVQAAKEEEEEEAAALSSSWPSVPFLS